MKNTILIITILLLFSGANGQLLKKVVDSTESGWIDYGLYKQQKKIVGEYKYVKYSNDSKYIYTYSLDKMFRQWESETGLLIKEFDVLYDSISDICIDINKNIIGIASNNGNTYIYDFNNDSLLYAVHSNYGHINDTNLKALFNSKIIFNPIYNEFVTSIEFEYDTLNESGTSGIINKWNKITGEHISKLPEGELESIAYSPNGNYLSMYLYKQFNVYHPNYYQYERRNKGCLLIFNKEKNNPDTLYHFEDDWWSYDVYENISFSSDSKTIVGTDFRRIKFWNTFNNHLDKTLNTSILPYDDTFSKSLFSYDGKYFLLITYNNIFRFFHSQTLNLIDSLSIDNKNYVFDISPFSKRIMYGLKDGRLLNVIPNLWSSSLKAKFVTDSLKVPTEQVIKFYDCSSGNPTIWVWDFGDGAVSDQQYPVHIYRKSGLHTVKLTVSDGLKMDTYVKVINVNILKPPKVNFTKEIIRYGKPLVVKFHNLSDGDIVSCIWDFGDGTVSTEFEPLHYFIDDGDYSISLTVSDGYNVRKKTIENLISVVGGKDSIIEFEKILGEHNYANTSWSGYETSNGGFIIIANHERKPYTRSYQQEIYRLDSLGKIINFYIQNFSNKIPGLIQLSNDNSLIYFNKNIRSNNYNYFINKIDSNENLVWTKEFESYLSEELCDTKATTDGGFILLTNIAKDIYDRNYDSIIIRKYDNEGYLQFSNSFILPDSIVRLYWKGKLLITKDNGLAIIGSYNKKLLYIKTDKLGKIQFIKSINLNGSFYGNDVILSDDDGFILCGVDANNQNYSGIIIKIDKEGNKLWERKYKETSFIYLYICKLLNNYFAIASGQNGRTGFTVIDGEGNEIKEIIFSDRPGEIVSISSTNNGGVLLTGRLSRSDSSSCSYIVKTKNILEYLYIKDKETISNKILLNISPNPVSSLLNINYNVPSYSFVKLSVCDIFGNEIKTIVNEFQSEGNKSIESNVSSMTDGFYFIKLQMGSEQKIKKFVKLN